MNAKYLKIILCLSLGIGFYAVGVYAGNGEEENSGSQEQAETDSKEVDPMNERGDDWLKKAAEKIASENENNSENPLLSSFAKSLANLLDKKPSQNNELAGSQNTNPAGAFAMDIIANASLEKLFEMRKRLVPLEEEADNETERQYYEKLIFEIDKWVYVRGIDKFWPQMALNEQALRDALRKVGILMVETGKDSHIGQPTPPAEHPPPRFGESYPATP